MWMKSDAREKLRFPRTFVLKSQAEARAQLWSPSCQRLVHPDDDHKDVRAGKSFLHRGGASHSEELPRSRPPLCLFPGTAASAPLGAGPRRAVAPSVCAVRGHARVFSKAAVLQAQPQPREPQPLRKPPRWDRFIITHTTRLCKAAEANAPQPARAGLGGSHAAPRCRPLRGCGSARARSPGYQLCHTRLGTHLLSERPTGSTSEAPAAEPLPRTGDQRVLGRSRERGRGRLAFPQEPCL